MDEIHTGEQEQGPKNHGLAKESTIASKIEEKIRHSPIKNMGMYFENYKNGQGGEDMINPGMVKLNLSEINMED